MVDTRAINKSMPLSIMEALGMVYESMYSIDSRKVPTYVEMKDFYTWTTVAPHIKIVLTIIVVELPLTYEVVLGIYWSAMFGGYIMDDGSCIMLPKKDGTMMRVPHEPKKPFPFKKKRQ
jgi:hypothetical protein